MSVICCGMPDPKETLLNAERSVGGLRVALQRAIDRFEPRLSDVEVLDQGRDDKGRILLLVRGVLLMPETGGGIKIACRSTLDRVSKLEIS